MNIKKESTGRIAYCYYLLVMALGLVFGTNTVSAQIVAGGVSDGAVDIAYGAETALPDITFTEYAIADFGLTVGETAIDTILIAAPDGFYFGGTTLTTGTSGDIFEVNPLKFSVDLTNVKLSFQITTVITLDIITISGLELIPIKDYTGSYSEKRIKISRIRGDFTLPDTYSDAYTMKIPSINKTFTIDSDSCGLDTISFNLSITGPNVNELKEFNVTLDDKSILYEKKSIASLSHTFETFDISNVNSKIKFNLVFNNNWNWSDSLSIGNIFDATDIRLKDIDSIKFNTLAEKVFSIYLNTVDLRNQIKDYDPSYSFAATSPANCVNSYVFYPPKANYGENTILVSRVNPENSCLITRPLKLLVAPDIINSDPFYCYGADNNNEINISYGVMGYYNTQTVKTSFNSFQVVFGKVDNTIKFTDKNDENGFYKYTIHPSDIFDVLRDADSNLEEAYIKLELWGNVETWSNVLTKVYTDLQIYYAHMGSFMAHAAFDSIQITQHANIPTDYYYHVDAWNYVNKMLSSSPSIVETEVVKISLPKTDGILIDFDTVYCPANIEVGFLSNYTIDSVTSTNGGVVDTNKASYNYQYYNPYLAWNKNIPITNDNVTLFYKDPNGCMLEKGYNIVISADTIVDKSGTLLNFAHKYCPVDKDLLLQSSFPKVDSITGLGVEVNKSSIPAKYYYNPLKVYRGANPFDTLSTIKNVLTLYYKDNKGCPYSNSIPSVISIDSVVDKSGTLLDFDTTYCPVNESYQLRSSFSTIDSITGRGVKSENEESKKLYYFYPLESYRGTDSSQIGLIEMYDTVSLYYKDNNACPYYKNIPVLIYPKPDLSLSVSKSCLGGLTRLDQQSSVNGTGSIEQWYWNFGDDLSISNGTNLPDSDIDSGTHSGNTSGKYNQPSHRYNNPGVYNVVAQATSSTTCLNSDTLEVIVGDYPKMDISYKNKLLTEPTIFFNHTTAQNYDPVVSYNWYFNDAALNASESLVVYDTTAISIDYKTAGVHKVTLKATTNNGCASNTLIYVPSFPVVEVDLSHSYDFADSKLPYGWIASQEYIKNLASGWKYVPVQGVFNDGDKHTSGYMWQTGNPAEKINNEAGWLESPCFDITDLSFPMLSLDIFQSMEEGRDGAVVQYTTDDGANWKTLGSDKAGTEWYNAGGIFSEPGKSNGGENVGWNGWSKNTKAWATARHPIDDVRGELSGVGCVRFRIAYSSNDYHDTLYAGLGIDNVLISKRKRIVLFEQLVNSKRPTISSVGFDDFLENLPAEICDMRYHFTIIHDQDILADNVCWQDNSARAAEYGAIYNEMVLMDGLVFDNFDIATAFTKRSLTDPAFEIEDVAISNDGNKMHVSAKIRKISNHIYENNSKHMQIVRIAIVQKEMTDINGKIHKNVVLDLLPTGSGNVVARIEPSMGVGEAIEVSETWTPNAPTIGNKYKVVIYVQGWWGVDEVQQVWFGDMPVENIPQISSVNNPTALAGEFQMYPNPMSDKLHIITSEEYTNDCIWTIYSVGGSAVKQGTIISGNNETVISVQDLAKGIYLVELKYKDGTRITKKIAKAFD